jgi:threonine/homoserine/homoserine lactone efflux protein
MLGITGFPLFLLAVMLLNVTPGPDTAYIVARSVSQGRRAGFVSVLGISAGCVVHTLATAFGLTAILAASAAAFTVIKVAGAAYLIYLGTRMIFAKRVVAPASGSSADYASVSAPASVQTPPESNRSAANPGVPDEAIDRTAAPQAALTDTPKSLRALFTQGFWTNVLNPKVVLFFVSFFPQFVSAGSPHKTLAFLALGGTFIVMSTVWNGFVSWIAGSVTHRMRGRPGFKRWLDRTVGTAFVGLGIRLALIHR